MEHEKIAGIRNEIFIPLFLISLFLLNCFLKFYGIGNSSFWIDEAYSVSLAQRHIPDIINHCASTDNPPFYFLLLHFWIKVFGISEAAVRSMSAVFSISTALLLFHHAKKYIGLATAVFVSLIFTVANQHLFYAQETRNYALVALLSIASAYFYSELFYSGKIKSAIFLTLVNILLVFTHYMAGFLIACEGLVSLVFISSNRKFFSSVALSCIVVVLALAPWIKNVLTNIPEEGKFWLERPTFYNFKGVFIDFAGNKVSLVIMFVIIAAGKFLLWKKWKADKKEVEIFQPLFYLTWAFVIVVVIYFMAMIRPIFLTRYLMFCSLGLYLAAGYFLFSLKIEPFWKTGLAVLLLVSMAVSLRLHPEREEHWREAVELVKKTKTGDDVVVVSVWYTNNIFSYYYDKTIFKSYDEIDKRLNAENIFPTSIMDAETYNRLPPSKRIILIQSHQVDDDPENTVMNILASRSKKSSSVDFNKVQVHIFERQ